MQAGGLVARVSNQMHVLFCIDCISGIARTECHLVICICIASPGTGAMDHGTDWGSALPAREAGHGMHVWGMAWTLQLFLCRAGRHV